MFKILEHGSDVMFEIHFNDINSFFEQMALAFRKVMVDFSPKGTMIVKNITIKDSGEYSTNAIRYLNELIYTFDLEWLIPIKCIEIEKKNGNLIITMSMERIRDPGSLINIPKAATYSGGRTENASPLRIIVDI